LKRLGGGLFFSVLVLSLLGGFTNAKGTDGQQPLLVSDYPGAFKSNTLVVVGDGFPHGPKGKYSLTIDGLCGAWIAVKLAEYFEAPGIVTDSDITSWQGKTVDLLDRTHNLIVVGCHWVNIVSYHYFFMRRDLVPVYPANYLNDDPLIFPEFLVKKDTGERFAYWNAIQDKYKSMDYAVMVALRDGNRNVLILWAYWEHGTIAMTRILENINDALKHGWRLNSEAVFVVWNDIQDDDKVQLNEITVQPLFPRSQPATYSYTKTIPTVTMTQTKTEIRTSTTTSTAISLSTVIRHNTTVTVKAASPAERRCIFSSLLPAATVQPLRSFRDSSVHATFAGSTFMEAFDVFYYSLSPKVVSFITPHLLLQGIVRSLLYPTIAALQFSSKVFDPLSFAPELAMVAFGVAASALIGLAYLTPLLVARMLYLGRTKPPLPRSFAQATSPLTSPIRTRLRLQSLGASKLRRGRSGRKRRCRE